MRLPPGFVLDSTPGPFSVDADPILAQRAREEEERKRQDQILQQQAAAQAAQAAATAQEKANRERREWEATHNPDGSPKPNLTGDGAEAARKNKVQNANLDALVGQINRVQDLYNKGLRDEAYGWLSSMGEYLPTPENRQFDSAAAGMAEQGLAAFRVPGVGAQSDTELRQFVEANKPSASDYDTQIEEKLRQLRLRVNSTRSALGLPPAEWTMSGAQTVDQRDQRAPGVAGMAGPPSGGQGPTPGSYGSANPTPPMLGPGDPQYTAGSQTRTVSNPALEAEYRKRLATQSDADILNWLQSQNVGPQTIFQAMEQLKYRKQHPEVPASAYSITSNREVPLSAYESAITGMGSGAAGAYALGAGQFLTGNTLDNMASDPERARLAMDVAKGAHGDAYTVGEISGGIMGSLAGEAALARLGMAPSFLRGLASDVTMGAANGAGAADNGNLLLGAAQGGLSAGIGTAGGTVAARGIGRALSPTGGPLAPLYEAGVRPTPGQRFANSGVVGGALNTAEQALQSIPVVGSAIRGARQEARDQFQTGAFNEALREIGEQLPKGMKPGTDPHAFAQSAFNRVYQQARSGMRMVADEELANEIGQLAPDINALGRKGAKQLQAILASAVGRHSPDGVMEGKAYQAALSDLGKHIARLRGSAMANDHAMADVLQGVETALSNAARRHSDPAAVQLLDAADAGYAKLVRIEEAARRRGGDAGTFSPANFDSSVQRSAGGVRSKAYLRGDALMQDYAKAGRALDDTLPDSGTAGRLATQAATGGAIGGGVSLGVIPPAALGILGAIGGAYAPGVRRATKGVMAPPGPSRKWIARQLEKRARLIGRVGAASGAASLPGTGPSQ